MKSWATSKSLHTILYDDYKIGPPTPLVCTLHKWDIPAVRTVQHIHICAYTHYKRGENARMHVLNGVFVLLWLSSSRCTWWHTYVIILKITNKQPMRCTGDNHEFMPYKHTFSGKLDKNKKHISVKFRTVILWQSITIMYEVKDYRTLASKTTPRRIYRIL